MKKYYLLKMTLNLIAFLVISLSQGQADIWEDYLKDVEGKFDAAPTITQKYKIITEPINKDYLDRQQTPYQNLNEALLRAGVSCDPLVYEDKGSGQKRLNWQKTVPLAVAISLGRRDLVLKFLTAIENVNDPVLTTWGFCQPYTLAHIALDPQYPRASQDVPLENRLLIIDALGENGADFNAIIDICNMGGVYTNPPLAAGKPSGRVEDTFIQVRARALLYGADPQKTGSSFSGINLNCEKPLLSYALNYYIERIKARAKVFPAPLVMDYLKRMALERGMDLDLLLQTTNEVQRIEKQIQRNETEIQRLTLQKTKKAKRKRQHLEMIQKEWYQDLKVLNRKLRAQGRDI